MARPRTPSALLEMSGAFDHDPQRRAARELEPVPAGPLGDPPAHLEPDAVEIWHELAGQVPAGVLTIADRILVEIVAKQLARFRRNEAMKAAELNQIISCLSRMGLTPADRSKIAARTPEREQQSDTFSRIASTARGRKDLE